MTPVPPSEPLTDAQSMRNALRRDLVVAIKARDGDTTAALRTAMAAIDNSEAVDAQSHPAPSGGAHIAGAASGVGSTEEIRRELTASELHAILQDQITEHIDEAERYDALDQAAAARRLRSRADVLKKHLER
jgi:hypothetical protein